MRDDFRRLAHAGLTFNAPLSEERASALVSALPISPGHHVLDLGCGWGELLLRILAAHPATTGTGVDTDKEALDRGVRAATRRGLHGRVEFVEAPAETFVDVADIVVCVASSHAFGGTGDALHWLRQSVDARRPRALRRRLLGGRAVGRGARDDRRAARGSRSSTRPRPRRASGSSATRSPTSAEWDAFEAGWRSGLEVSTDPEAVAFAARAPARVRGRLPRGDRLRLARARAAVRGVGLTPRARRGSLAATTFCPSRS